MPELRPALLSRPRATVYSGPKPVKEHAKVATAKEPGIVYILPGIGYKEHPLFDPTARSDDVESAFSPVPWVREDDDVLVKQCEATI